MNPENSVNVNFHSQVDVLSHYLEMAIKNPGGGGMLSESAGVWDAILTRQSERRIKGDMAEIGVFNGFGAALFCAYLANEERARLVDIAQIKDQATETIVAVAGQDVIPKLEFIQSDSMRLRQTKEVGGSFRFIHIDGEHSYDAVINDLALAEHWLSPMGVIVVDDFFSASCPGITEAVFDFCRSHNDVIVPFLIGYNKAYLCRSRYLGMYRGFILDLPERLESHGLNVQLCAGGFAHERTYFGISGRASVNRYQLVGRYIPDAETFISAINDFW